MNPESQTTSVPSSGADRRRGRRLFRRGIVTSAVAAATLVGVAGPAAAWDVDALYGQRRQCAEGYLNVGVASQLDATQFSDGSLHLGGRVKDGCTDGQLMQLWYRQHNAFGSVSGWSAIQTGNSFHSSFGRWLTPMRFVTDVEVVVCRSGSDGACGPSRFLHV